MNRRFRLLAAVFGLLPVISGANTDLIQVTAVRAWSYPSVTRIILETTGPFEFKADRAHDPERLFFDVPHARPWIAQKRLFNKEIGDKLVQRIRVAETAPGTTRVVFDLTVPAKFKVTRLNAPDRMVIELRPMGAAEESPTPTEVPTAAPVIAPPEAKAVAKAAASVAPAIAPTRVPAPGPLPVTQAIAVKPVRRRFVPPVAARVARPQISVPFPAPQLPIAVPELPLALLIDPLSRLTPGQTEPAAAAPVIISSTKVLPAPQKPPVTQVSAKAGENASRSMTRALGLKVNRIVIDAGHGGHDDGTIGPHGVLEKDVVLDVAVRLGKLVQERMGAEVVLTRSEDNFIPLHERTAIANSHKADLFLSIHANSSPAKEVAGTETFFLNFTTSTTALDVAARENAGSEKSVGELKDLVQSITLNDKIEESQTFAGSVENALYAQAAKGNPAAHNRGVKRAPFVVLIGASMPSVLAEIGFLSNPKDEANLGKPEYRQKVAEALYKGLAQYSQSLSHFEGVTKVARAERNSGAGTGVQH